MPIFDLKIDDAQEFQTAPAGEYQLQVQKVEEKKSKEKGEVMLAVQLKILQGPNLTPDMLVGDVFHYFTLPGQGAEPKTDNMRKLDLRNFQQALGVADVNRIDTDAWVGQTVWAVLKVDPGNDNYGASNRVKDWVAQR